MDLTTLTLDKFVDATASGDPVPGGGSISALCGALAAALGTMVGRLTLGKKKYADVQPEIQVIVDKLSNILPTLLRAVDLDSEAYDMVFTAYKMPKDTDAEREERTNAIQSALKHAASVPMAVATAAAIVMPDLERLAIIGNQNAITDAYVATLCARTAVLGACANVRINLGSINDPDFVDGMTRQAQELEEKASEAEARVSQILHQSI